MTRPAPTAATGRRSMTFGVSHLEMSPLYETLPARVTNVPTRKSGVNALSGHKKVKRAISTHDQGSLPSVGNRVTWQTVKQAACKIKKRWPRQKGKCHLTTKWCEWTHGQRRAGNRAKSQIRKNGRAVGKGTAPHDKPNREHGRKGKYQTVPYGQLE